VTLRQELDGLYIPEDERQLARIQRKADRIDSDVRAWAASIVRVLPKGLSLLEDEHRILILFLAQQRRLNLEIDAGYPDTSFRARLARILPFMEDPDDLDSIHAAHRVVATQLDSDLERACTFFCEDRGVPHMDDSAIEWRASIRFLAQSLHRIGSEIGDIKRKFDDSPRRFELALIARDLAAEIIDKRRSMLVAFKPSTA
jgi:hypothetical protein